jgi:hypothetical protein
MRKSFFAILLLCLSIQTQGQLNDNAYRNANNPLYWQNRKPDANYWQQDVHYQIDAAIDEVYHVINGRMTLEYWNNSPDTLHYVYFHLFQNAFTKDAHLRALERGNKQRARLGKREAAGLGTETDSIRVDGVPVRTELDNTVMKIYLPKPLYPGAKTTFSMKFRTWYDRGSTRRRMQMYEAWGFMHYNGVQWFPKICVYDRKFGWDTHQHLNKEFYADFGSYDVRLDFPSNYIVEATGVLVNRKEVLPDTLREKLDLKHFANKKWDEPPSIIIPYEKGVRKVWHFRAENVHDFAFTADPSYRIATVYWNGIECVGLAQEPHAAGWQNSAEYVARIIRTFSEDIGMYQYPKMVAADARDGMEYPMLTLDGGRDPGYRGLLVHEIAHNWFYGMVGNNETYRAALDEGFTQFLTAWGLRRIDGDTMVYPPAKGYRALFSEPALATEKRVFDIYTLDALNQKELPLNTHSNDFQNALGHEGGYRQVYYKAAAMLYNLQYTLGDSLFLEALRHYFHQWQFAHPYFEDFRASIINFTKVDLNWFFDQWLETTKTIDYSIGRIRRIPGQDSFAIRLHRRGAMQMPIDFTVQARDGAKHSFHIPNTWFVKKTEASVLPKWYGWGKMHPVYEARVHIPSGIRSVQIDTSFRLADRAYTDNYKSRHLPLSPRAIRLKADGGMNPPLDRRQYRLYVRPDLWYNPVDGVKAGIHFEGNYLNTLSRVDATVWWNTHAGQTNDYLSLKNESYYARYIPVNYTFDYNTPVSRSYPALELQLNSRILDGLNYHRGGLNWQQGQNLVELYGQTLWRSLSYDLDYLIYPQEWSSMRSRPNASLNAAWTHQYRYFRGDGRYRFGVRAPIFNGNSGAAFNYSFAQLEAVNKNYLHRLEIRTRLFARYGAGSNIPQESALWLAGANPEELMDNKYVRTVGVVPEDWRGISPYETNHFQQGGGLNLRGYAGYFVADERGNEVLIGYKGRSGATVNLEVDIDNYIPLRPAFTKSWLHSDVYLFADAGIMELNRYRLNEYWQAAPAGMWSDLRVDAGLGFAFTVTNWGVFEKAKPLTLRVDLPFFINRPPYGNPEYLKLRYVVGINRSF